MTNVEKVTHYMEFGPQGPLGQAFVMEAITRYAVKVLEHKAELREQMQYGIVHPDAWIKCAQIWKDMMDGKGKKSKV